MTLHRRHLKWLQSGESSEMSSLESLDFIEVLLRNAFKKIHMEINKRIQQYEWWMKATQFMTLFVHIHTEDGL